ncbi:hypothetical protein OSTOST_13799, partial [Ostertagia ostertagi]
PSKAAKLFGVDADQFISALVRPRIKVGTEWVHKGQNKQQVDWAVGTLAKAIYARMFTWLIKRVNKTLAANLEESAHYIGVLDIAGFEIFDVVFSQQNPFLCYDPYCRGVDIAPAYPHHFNSRWHINASDASTVSTLCFVPPYP